MHSLNTHGDKLIATTGKHGSDIASQRMDDLDIASIQYALSLQGDDKRGLDIGCGYGTHGIRMAMLDMTMLLVDTLDIKDRIDYTAQDLGLGTKLNYLKEDARKLASLELKPFDLIYSQRFIHYLSFDEASELIRTISTLLKPGGKLFISASGMLSELGNNYEGKDKPIKDRHHKLDADMAEKHGIHEPVCLYTEDEMSELVVPYGFTPERIWSSSFGNIKAVFTKANSH